MGEPARKYNADIQPDIRPSLTAIDGGNETNNQRASLRSVAENDLSQLEQAAGERSNVIQGPWDNNTDNRAAVDNAESQPKTPTFVSNVTGENTTKQPFFARFKSNKKALWSLGIGGTLGGLLIAAFLALLPLKLEMFIQNISKQASAVPAYAVEQRTEYLITRALATRMMMMANGSQINGGDVVFCKNSSIACSLFHTYTSEYFEKKMDLTFEKRTDGKVKLTIGANGRDRLGSKARSWDITVSRDMSDGGVLETVKSIQTNAEMKAYITKRVKNDMKSSSTVTRFLARRILMKKYGVTHWRGFEKTSNKIADVQSSFKAGLIKNTVGKILPRTSLYLACLSGGAACEKLLDASTVDPESIADKNSDEYKKAKAQQDLINKFKGISAGDVDATNTPLGKIVSKQLITKVGGAVAIVSIADLAFRAVAQVDNGALEKVSSDINKTAYVGMAFGDETGLVVNNEKMKAGDIDIDTLATATSLMDGAEKSPLMQAENGIMTASATTQVTRDCKTENGTVGPTTLEPGQLVCPENRLVRDYTSTLQENPAWQDTATVSKAWVAGPGQVVDFANTVLGGLTDMLINSFPGAKEAFAALGGALQQIMENMISLFDVPDIGFSAPGANNYDANSGGIRTAQNELMEQGVGIDGKAYGGGGTVLSNVQVASIQSKDRAADAEYYAAQPVMARIFNPSLTGSFAQRFLATMPTSFSSLASLPSLSLQSALSPSSANAAGNTAVVNPFNLPIYGYAEGDAALTADPTLYNPESCAASAKAREDSLAVHAGVSKIPTYSVADPCALEKMVVGAALTYEGITTDPYSLPELQAEGGAAAVTGSLANSGNIKDNGWAWPAPKGTTACGFNCYAGHFGMDVLGVDVGTDVYAARDGVVTNAGPDLYMTSSTVCNAATGGFAPFNGTQYTIVIKHTVNGQRVDTLYTHLDPNGMKVKVGDTVKAGDFIAKSGNSGCTTGPHLHFGIYVGGYPSPRNAVDPTTILGTSG